MNSSITFLVFFVLLGFGSLQRAAAQPTAAEIRSMADLCSSGASVKFRGDIAVGLTRMFGKVITGEGEYEASRGENDFLNSFKDERLRLEARRIYNDCAIQAIEAIRENMRQQSALHPEELEVIEGSSAVVPIGRVFRLSVGQSAILAGGGVFSVEAGASWRKNPVAKLSNRGSGTGTSLRGGSVLEIPHRRGCTVTFMGKAENATGADGYNFVYDCG